MKGDIALAGYVLTAEEWHALDPVSRAQLLAAVTRSADPWVVTPITGLLSEPVQIPAPLDE
ncbi:MAG TPA: hypothetical protein VLX92_01690 [Kofleriaceae bacterium]|nr:hypothetical protein [Kofleriaceae bacterium]